MVRDRGMGRIRKRPLLFILLYLVATVGSLYLSTIRPETASADANTNLINLARAWVGYKFIQNNNSAQWFVETGPGGLSQEDVDKMKYIPKAGNARDCWDVKSGYLLEPKEGVMNIDASMCSNPFTTSNRSEPAFTAMFSGIGYDRTSFVTSLGYKKDSSGLYKGGDMSQGKLEASLKAKWPSAIEFPGLGSGTPPGWVQYLDLVEGLQKGSCLKAGLTEFPSPPSSSGTIISLVDAQGTVGKYSVEVVDKRIAVAVESEISCQDAANRLADGDGAKAKEYAGLLGKITETTKQDCSAKYSSDDKLKTACEKGVENKDDPEFCTKTYSDQPSIDACKFGQEYAKTNETGTDPVQAAKEQKTCVIDGVGWIVCPVAKFVAGIIDGIFKYMIMPMIVTPPVNTSTQDNQLISAWGTMRNIANVIFIIAFMIVIYSQITSAGISNYGIKRMLPRLIIGAILLNTSYWICALAVDLSNVAGASIYNILMGIFNTTLSNTTWEAVIGVLLAGGVAGAGAGLAIGAIVALGAGSPMLMAALWIAIPLLIGAFLAVTTAAVVLALRQALIVILIVISPLAIAAYLLPNTQQWYEKWQKMFITMLVFFPLFAIIYGGSQVAASILVAASKSSSELGENMTAVILLLTAMVAQVFPLFSAPFVMKFSGGVLGSIGAKIQGGFGKLTAPINKYAKGRAGKNLELGKGRAFNGAGALASRDVGRIRGRFTRGVGRTLQGISSRGQRLDMGLEAAKAESEAIAAERAAVNPTLSDLDTQTRLQKERAESASRVQTEDYVSRLNANAGGEIATAAGIGGAAAQSRVRTKAQSAEQKVYEDAVKMADESARNNHMTFDQRLNAARTGLAADGVTQLSEAERDAHIQFAMGAGNTKERRSVLESAGSMTASQRSSAVGGARSKGDTELWGSSTLGKIEDGDASAMSDVAGTLKSSLQQRLAGGAVGGQKITGDNHTADMVMQEMSTMSSSDQESARANIDRFVSSEQGRGVTGEVRSTLGIAGAPASTSSAGASAPTGGTLTVEHGGRTYEQSPSGLLTPRDR